MREREALAADNAQLRGQLQSLRQELQATREATNISETHPNVGSPGALSEVGVCLVLVGSQRVEFAPIASMGAVRFACLAVRRSRMRASAPPHRFSR